MRVVVEPVTTPDLGREHRLAGLACVGLGGETHLEALPTAGEEREGRVPGLVELRDDVLEAGERPGELGQLLLRVDRGAAGLQLTERPTQSSLKAAMKLGFLDATAGKEAAAVPYYERALAINPSEPGAHYNLALVLRKLGDPRAEQHARMAARLGRPLPPAEPSASQE